MIFLFKQVIFRFHVSFRECIRIDWIPWYTYPGDFLCKLGIIYPQHPGCQSPTRLLIFIVRESQPKPLICDFCWMADRIKELMSQNWLKRHSFIDSAPARPKGGQRPASAVQRERERDLFDDMLWRDIRSIHPGRLTAGTWDFSPLGISTKSSEPRPIIFSFELWKSSGVFFFHLILSLKKIRWKQGGPYQL